MLGVSACKSKCLLWMINTSGDLRSGLVAGYILDWGKSKLVMPPSKLSTSTILTMLNAYSIGNSISMILVGKPNFFQKDEKSLSSISNYVFVYSFII